MLYRIWMTLLSMPLTVFFGIFTLLCAWSLTSLTLFHAMIISIAQTTNERVRGVYRYGGVVNAADDGCCHNWCNAFCTTRPPSRLPNDFSEIVFADNGRTGECGGVIKESVWNAEAAALAVSELVENGES